MSSYLIATSDSRKQKAVWFGLMINISKQEKNSCSSVYWFG